MCDVSFLEAEPHGPDKPFELGWFPGEVVPHKGHLCHHALPAFPPIKTEFNNGYGAKNCDQHKKSNGNSNVPKCEIFDLLDSHDFYTTQPIWVGDFVTVIKNSKAFLFGYDFEVCSAKF
jgi:hypothetical protein